MDSPYLFYKSLAFSFRGTCFAPGNLVCCDRVFTTSHNFVVHLSFTKTGQLSGWFSSGKFLSVVIHQYKRIKTFCRAPNKLKGCRVSGSVLAFDEIVCQKEKMLPLLQRPTSNCVLTNSRTELYMRHVLGWILVATDRARRP